MPFSLGNFSGLFSRRHADASQSQPGSSPVFDATSSDKSSPAGDSGAAINNSLVLSDTPVADAMASAPEWSASADPVSSVACTTAVVTTANAAGLVAGMFGSLESVVGPAQLNFAGTLLTPSSSSASAALQADALRSTFGIDGTGIKIGVLSDSYNVRGGAASDIAQGLLPASGVQVLEEGPAGSTDEGRAMMELIHQIAPGASLAFYSATQSESAFANGITALTNAGCNIIVDDVSYLDEPFFQDGTIAQAVNAAAARGVAYFTAAGNEASNAYQATYSPIASFLPNGTFVGDAQNFGGGNVAQSITMTGGSVFLMQWDQAWGLATSNLDVRVFQNGVQLANFTRFNSGLSSADPFVGFSLNPSAGTQTFQIVITNDSGPNPGLIKYMLF